MGLERYFRSSSFTRGIQKQNAFLDALAQKNAKKNLKCKVHAFHVILKKTTLV